MTRSNTATKERPQAASALSLTVDRADFLKALSHAAAIVERRNTIPVLSNVLLEAGTLGSGPCLRITSTDLNMQIAVVTPARVFGHGATTVSAALLHGIVRELPDGPVELKIADGRLNVIGGRSRYKLQTLPSDQFPVFPPQEEVETRFSLTARELLEAFKRTAFAQSVEVQTRHYLCGICLDTRDGELVFAATDGKCLASVALKAPNGVDIAEAILPSKFVASLSKLLEDVECDIQLSLQGPKITVTVGSAVLTSKLVDGSYPDWRRVVPKDNDKRLSIASEGLGAAIRRASLVLNERVRAVKLELSPDKATVSATSPENGTSAEEVPCLWTGGEFVVGFDGKLLMDMIRASEAEELQIDMADSAGPALVTNPVDPTSKWVAMPYRV